MRIMKDSTAIDQIDPASVDLIAYYIDGAYVPSAAALARFAGKVHVPIAVHSRTNAGVVFDGPPDNGTWDEVVDWVVLRRRSGADPSVYTDQSDWATAIAAFNRRNVPPPHWWIAKWDGRAELIDGAYAHQYESIGNRWDTSAVADYWPGVDPIVTKPKPPAPPGPPPAPPGPTPAQLLLQAEQHMEDDDMIMVHEPSGGIYLVSGSLYAHIPETADVEAFKGAGVAQVNISTPMHQALEAASAALQGKLSGSLNISGQLSAS